MAAGKYTFTIEQGTTVKFGIQYLDPTGVPFDLTDCSARMQIRSDFADKKNVLYATLSSSIDNDGTGLDFAGINGDAPLNSGSIGVYISAAKTETFNFDEAIYDLEIYKVNEVTRVLEGSVLVSREVTRVNNVD